MPLHHRTPRRAVLAAAIPAALAAGLMLPGGASAGVIVAGNGPLDYHDGSGARQNVSVAVQGTTLRITDSVDGVALAGGAANPCSIVTRLQASCPLSRVSSIRAFLGAGDDSWISAVGIPTTVDGGTGNDEYLAAASVATSRVDFRGGAGADLTSYLATPAGVTVTKDGTANDGRSGRDGDNIRPDVERLTGSTFNDSLNGSNNTVESEVFDGGPGDDVLSGNGGADFFAMGRVADGADTINGGPGRDGVDYSARTQPITASLNLGDGNDGEAGEGDSLRTMEGVTGGQAADTLRAPFGSRGDYGLAGGSGADTLEGAEGKDTFFPGVGRDTVLARGEADVIFADSDNESDFVDCGAGIDTAHLDRIDTNGGCETRQIVGVLRLASKAITAKAGAPARVDLGWRHPQGWRKLRSVTLRLTDAGMPVGTVTVTPRDGKVTADGAVELARRATTLTRRGKAVQARLGLKVDPSVAGRRLGLEVEATDTQGRRQLERGAGTLRVAG